MFFNLIKKKSKFILGIDLGSYAIKAVAIYHAHGFCRVDAVVEVLMPKDLIIDNHLQDISKISAIIKQLQSKLPVHYRNVAIAVTGADVMTKVMSINSALNHFELERQIEIEVESNIPFPLDEVFIDFEVIGLNENDASLNNILVSTARKESVLSHAQCIDEAGFKTIIVDVASHALARSINILSPVDNNQGIAIIDIGASQIMLNIIYQGSVIFSRCKNYGGNAFTQMLVEHCGVSLQEAEDMKIALQLSNDSNNEVLTLFIDQIINHLHTDFHMFANAQQKINIAKIIIAGSGGLLPGFLKRLEDELNIETSTLEYREILTFKTAQDCELLEKSEGKFLMALGLALRGDDNVKH